MTEDMEVIKCIMLMRCQWGYRDYTGRIVATNPNDMRGNSGWEEVPGDTVPEIVEEPTAVLEPTIEQRQNQVEAALIEIAAMLGG